MIAPRKGFTLVEIVVVVLIIGLFFVMTTYFVNTSNTQQEQVMRFAEYIRDTLQDTRQNMVVGKGYVQTDGTDKTYIPVDERRVTFSGTSDNASIKLSYLPYQETDFIPEKELKMPLMDGDKKFRIVQLQISTGSFLPHGGGLTEGSSWKDVNKLDFVFGNQGILTLTGTSSDPSGDADLFRDAKVYQITVEYQFFKRVIVGTTVIGNSEVQVDQVDDDD